MVTTIDFSSLIDFHKAGGFELTLGVSEYSFNVPFGVVDTNSDGRVMRIREKPSYRSLINAGVYVLSPQIPNEIPHQDFYLMTDLIDNLLRSKRPVGAFHIHESWTDVGLPDQYSKIKDKVVNLDTGRSDKGSGELGSLGLG